MSANPQAMPPYPIVPQPAPKSWLARNWKWLLAGAFLMFLVLAVGGVMAIFGAMRSSDVAKESVLRAQANSLVVQGLGSPIKEGWFVSGSINVSTGSGNADLSIPISGPKGEGTVYVTAQKGAGEWTYTQMLAAVPGSNDRIDLLAGGSADSSGPGAAGGEQPAQSAASSENQPAAASPASDPSSAAAAGTSAPSSPSAPASDIIQTQDTNTSGVVGELTQCKRSDGVLSVKVRFHNTSAKPVEFTVLSGGSNYEKVYVTAANKKYLILKDSENSYLTSQADYSCGGPAVCARLGPGDSFNWWAKFPAPAADVKKINLMIPVGAPFEDVPITDK